MKLQKPTEDPMVSSFCFFKIGPFSLIASALVLSLVFYASFSGFGFSSILFTTSVLIVSTLLFTFSKEKPVTDHQEPLSSDHEITSSIQQQQPAESEAVAVKPQDHDEEQEQKADDDEGRQIHDCSIKSETQDFFLSESESLNHLLSSSEESEVEWPFREIVYQSPDCSDEENDLIEISLPTGHYVGNYNKVQEDPKFHFSKQHGLMELLAAEINDMNIYEEDNLIEIDISIGSIKCSRFEIEA